MAFPKGTDIADRESTGFNLGAFPTSAAQLAISAIDSSYFDVYAKDPAVAELLRRRFADVREEDADAYFDAQGPQVGSEIAHPAHE